MKDTARGAILDALSYAGVDGSFSGSGSEPDMPSAGLHITEHGPVPAPLTGSAADDVRELCEAVSPGSVDAPGDSGGHRLEQSRFEQRHPAWERRLGECVVRAKQLLGCE